MNYFDTLIARLIYARFAILSLLIAAFIGSLLFNWGDSLPLLLATIIMIFFLEYLFNFLPTYQQIMKQNEQLQVEKEQLEKANKEWEDMTRSMIHDLKSPLRAMGSFAELAKRRLPDYAAKDIKEYMEYITSNAKRMSHLMDAMMNFSKIGSKNTRKEEIILDDLLDEVKLNVLDIIKDKNVYVSTINLPVIHANRVQMMQVFQNLLENAMKYNQNEFPKIIIESEESDTHHILSVKDNGIGIRDEYKEKVFDLFERLNPHQFEGSGVGLSTCKKIVENHNGKIWLESIEGIGTQFYFSLPKPKTIQMFSQHSEFVKRQKAS